jgi:hypothetical protein
MDALELGELFSSLVWASSTTNYSSCVLNFDKNPNNYKSNNISYLV